MTIAMLSGLSNLGGIALGLIGFVIIAWHLPKKPDKRPLWNTTPRSAFYWVIAGFVAQFAGQVLNLLGPQTL